MFIDPRVLFMLAVLVGVTGLVVRGLMVTRYRLSKGGDRSSDTLREMEERLRKVEAATSSLLVDVSGMREKERFMARLQAGASAREAQSKTSSEGDLSPMQTQSIPISPRIGSTRG